MNQVTILMNPFPLIHFIYILFFNCTASFPWGLTTRGGIRSMWGLGPTMNAQGQSIGISIGMLLQTLIMSRLDQLSWLGARI